MDDKKTKLFDLKYIILIFVILMGSMLATGVVLGEFDDSGNLKVVLQDQFTEILDFKLTKKIADINLTENTSIDQDYLIISSPVAPVVDNVVCLKENKSFFQDNIISVTPLGGMLYNVTLGSPLDFAYTTSGGCSIRDDNWAVDGSVTPQTFSLSPAGLNNVSWDVTRMILICSGDGVGAGNDKPDTSSFFTQTAVTNGIVFRRLNGINKNLFNAKDNFHMAGETFDLEIYDANRQGEYAVVSRRTFSGQEKNGVTIRLDSETGDRFDIIIQDDLTDMTQCHTYVQGHVVD